MSRLHAISVAAIGSLLTIGCSRGRAADASVETTSSAENDSVAPRDVEIARVRDGMIIRGRTTRVTVPPGTERTSFLEAVARALEVDVDRLDLGASIVAHYGADELQVYECVQHAEDIWGVQLLPPRIPVGE